MNENISKEQIEQAAQCYREGYRMVQLFVKQEGTSPEFFIKAMVYDYENNFNEKNATSFFKDAGAVAWCLEQLQQSENQNEQH